MANMRREEAELALVIDGMPLYAKELIAGGMAGGFAKTVVAPLERVKILFQTRRSEFHSVGLSGSFNKIAKTEGILGFYRGNGASVARIVPYAAPSLYGIFPYAGLKFYFYEKMKSHVPEEHKKDLTVKLGCGSIAGLLGQTLTYPLDVVRRQMQVEQFSASTSNSEHLKGTMDGLIKIVQRQGWSQLFSGLSLNYLKVVLSVAIGFTMHDVMKDYLGVPSRDFAKGWREDSIFEYEKLAKEKRNEKSQQQEGVELNFLDNLGHVERIRILSGIPDMKNELHSFMKPIDPSKTITSEDVHQVFENLAKKRRRL